MKRKQHSENHSTDTGPIHADPLNNAILDLKGATCTSCAIAIEHLGKRIAQINDIYVDRASSTIKVSFVGDDTVLNQLCDFVTKLGYQATVREISRAGNDTR